MGAFVSPGLIDAILLGFSIGSIWLMAALGLTIIYGTIGVINMAHGEFIMLGAYTTYILQTHIHMPFLLCLPLSFIIVAAIGLVIERLLIRYLYDRPLDTLLATWGVSLVLIQAARLTFGSDPLYVAVPTSLTTTCGSASSASRCSGSLCSSLLSRSRAESGFSCVILGSACRSAP